MTSLPGADNARFTARDGRAGTVTSENGHIGAVVHVSRSQLYARVVWRSSRARQCGHAISGTGCHSSLVRLSTTLETGQFWLGQ